MEKLYLSRKETALALGVSLDTVDRLASIGALRREKIGARTVFYVPDVRAFAQRLVKEGAVSLA